MERDCLRNGWGFNRTAARNKSVLISVTTTAGHCFSLFRLTYHDTVSS